MVFVDVGFLLVVCHEPLIRLFYFETLCRVTALLHNTVLLWIVMFHTSLFISLWVSRVRVLEVILNISPP